MQFAASVVFTTAMLGCQLVFPYEAPPTVPLVSGQHGLIELVAERDQLYWTVGPGGAGEVRTCAMTGCSPRVLAPVASSPVGLEIHTGRVFWADGTSIFAIIPDDGTQANMVVTDPNPITDFSFARSSGELYLMSEQQMMRCTNYKDSLATCSGGDSPFLLDNTMPVAGPGRVVTDPRPDTMTLLWAVNAVGVHEVEMGAGAFRERLYPLPTGCGTARELAVYGDQLFAVCDNDVFSWALASPTDAPLAVSGTRLTGNARAVYVGTNEGDVTEHLLAGGPERTVANFGVSIVALTETNRQLVVGLADGTIHVVPL